MSKSSGTRLLSALPLLTTGTCSLRRGRRLQHVGDGAHIDGVNSIVDVEAYPKLAVLAVDAHHHAFVHLIFLLLSRLIYLLVPHGDRGAKDDVQNAFPSAFIHKGTLAGDVLEVAIVGVVVARVGVGAGVGVVFFAVPSWSLTLNVPEFSIVEDS